MGLFEPVDGRRQGPGHDRHLRDRAGGAQRDPAALRAEHGDALRRARARRRRRRQAGLDAAYHIKRYLAAAEQARGDRRLPVVAARRSGATTTRSSSARSRGPGRPPPTGSCCGRAACRPTTRTCRARSARWTRRASSSRGRADDDAGVGAAVGCAERVAAAPAHDHRGAPALRPSRWAAAGAGARGGVGGVELRGVASVGLHVREV